MLSIAISISWDSNPNTLSRTQPPATLNIEEILFYIQAPVNNLNISFSYWVTLILRFIVFIIFLIYIMKRIIYKNYYNQSLS